MRTRAISSRMSCTNEMVQRVFMIKPLRKLLPKYRKVKCDLTTSSTSLIFTSVSHHFCREAISFSKYMLKLGLSSRLILSKIFIPFRESQGVESPCGFALGDLLNVNNAEYLPGKCTLEESDLLPPKAYSCSYSPSTDAPFFHGQDRRPRRG